MASITKEQIKTIYSMGAQLDMVRRGDRDDELHQLVAGITGKGGVSDMEKGEASEVIKELDDRLRFGAVKAPPKVKKRSQKKSGRVSESLQNKMWAMMYELQKHDIVPSTASLGDRLAGIIRKTLNIDATAKDPFIWLNNNDANYLIDKVLKNYIASAKKKVGAGDARSGVG